jgi:hypothetical protein
MVLLDDSTVCRYKKTRFHFFVCLLFFMSCAQHKVQEETLPFYNTAEFDAEWIKETDDNCR